MQNAYKFKEAIFVVLIVINAILALIFSGSNYAISSKDTIQAKILYKVSSSIYQLSFTTDEPPNDKTDKMACAPSEDSDQPGRPLSLIRALAVRMKKPWVLSNPLSAQRRL